MTHQRPLEGVRVVSVADHYPGPFASMLLADWGADVVNVERPGGDPARAFPAFHAALARGKRSAVLDLKAPLALDAFYALVRTADVVIEGYRPGVARRLAIDHPTLRRIKPDLVYVSISGFGQDGPYRDAPAHDLNVQALAGVIAQDPNVAKASPPEPPRAALADLSAGHAAAQAVLLGLLRRAGDGEGSYTDVAMLDCALTVVATDMVAALDRTAGPGLEYEAGYGLFVCADGESLALGIANDQHFWEGLVAVLSLAPTLRDLTGPERIARRTELQQHLAVAFRREPRGTWLARFEQLGVPAAAVNDLHDVVHDPQVVARGMLVTGPGGAAPRFVRQPLTIDGTRWGPRSGVPGLGADTRRVLAAAGVPDYVVSQLAEHAATAPAPAAR